MRKRIVGGSTPPPPVVHRDWLDLEALASVEVTSEDPGHPVESALVAAGSAGWRAAAPGKQTLRLLFDAPQRLDHNQLVVREEHTPRTQEIVLRWSADHGRNYHEIVRQQFSFAPPDTSIESEDWTVDLAGVDTLELEIVPEISGGPARASVLALRLAG